MSDLTVDSKFPRHLKVAPLSDAAFRLHVAALSYCAEHETDGFVPESEITTLTKHQDKTPLIQELEDAKGPREDGHPLWRRSARGKVTGFEIHDYLEWNASHAELEAERDRANGKRTRNRYRMKTSRAPTLDVAQRQCTLDAQMGAQTGAQAVHEAVHKANTDGSQASPARVSPQQVSNSKQESGSGFGDPDGNSIRARGGAGGRGSTIAEDWTLTAKDREFASGRGWDAQRMAEEADRFLAHHLAKGTLSKNWGASWITWVLQGIRFDRLDARQSGVQRTANRYNPSKSQQPDIDNPAPPAKVIKL